MIHAHVPAKLTSNSSGSHSAPRKAIRKPVSVLIGLYFFATMSLPAKSVPTRSPPLPIIWQNLTDKNVKQLQRLNTTIFPVKYNQLFYSEALKAPPGFVRLAYCNDLLVGAVCCRKEKYVPTRPSERVASHASPSSNDVGAADSMSSLYIMTLGVLAPYRERGVGRRLITHVLDLVDSSPHCADVVDVYLHVQESNDEALRFYEGYGFHVKEKLIGYYKRIEPADCYIVRKTVERK